MCSDTIWLLSSFVALVWFGHFDRVWQLQFLRPTFILAISFLPAVCYTFVRNTVFLFVLFLLPLVRFASNPLCGSFLYVWTVFLGDWSAPGVNISALVIFAFCCDVNLIFGHLEWALFARIPG